HPSRLLTDDVMCQSVQGADAVAVERLEGIIEEAFDARFEVIHRGIDERHDQHFLVTAEGAAGDDLRRKRREDLRLACARHRGNTEATAAITENLFLRRPRDKVKCHVFEYQV